MSRSPQTPSLNWSEGKPNLQLQLSQRVKAIILAKVAELRAKRIEQQATADEEGGQADD